MGGRIKKAWRAVMAPAEDPRRVLPDAHERQRELLGSVRRARASVRASRKRLNARADLTRQRLPALEAQARTALVRGRDDLARVVLQHREVAAAELQALETQAAELGDKELQLGLLEQRLTSEIEAFLEREDLLEARQSAAAAQVHVSESLAAVAQELADFDLALEQSEATAEELETQAAVIDRMAEAGRLDDPDRLLEDLIERRLPGIDVSAAVENRLDALADEVREARARRE